MKIDMYHASKFGNGAKVAEELRRVMTEKGHQMYVQHIDEVKPRKLPTADLYIFCSPTRLGKPLRGMRGFVKKASLPDDARYALIATHGKPEPNKKTGVMPTQEEIERFQRTIPILDELLKEKGGVKVADVKIYVNQLKGPLVDGWEKEIEDFASRLG